ncbi:MAG: SIS domain-containing protein [Phycisphaerae bacterium]|nr:SIS domain-containing protein [Phycisphaerae bacterium]
MDFAAFAASVFAETRDLAAANARDEALCEALARVAEACAGALAGGGRILTFGNGGSMCDASHFAEELTGRYRKDRRPLAAMALNDPGHITCTANDFGYDQIFARGVVAHARRGDVVIGFSTSGNSANVIEAIRAAHDNDLRVVALTGKGGGKIGEMLREEDIHICVPAERTAAD